MGGKGEKVSYTREFKAEMGKLSAADKQKLIDIFTDIINTSKDSLTLIALQGDKPPEPKK